jgi:hypothetical protein
VLAVAEGPGQRGAEDLGVGAEDRVGVERAAGRLVCASTKASPRAI